MLLSVPHESVSIAVGFGTGGAFVRTDPLVKIHVVVKKFLPNESGIANGAWKRIFRLWKMAFVHPFVPEIKEKGVEDKK